MKNLTARRPSRNSTLAWIAGLTVFYFIAKTLGHR